MQKPRRSNTCSVITRNVMPITKRRFTGNLAGVAHMIEPAIVRPLVLPDPADDPVLYTAADGKANVLCTLNIRHFDADEVRRFCAARSGAGLALDSPLRNLCS
jgi:hypothetical protein